MLFPVIFVQRRNYKLIKYQLLKNDLLEFIDSIFFCSLFSGVKLMIKENFV